MLCLIAFKTWFQYQKNALGYGGLVVIAVLILQTAERTT